MKPKYIPVQVLWHTDESSHLAELGIDSDNYYYKEVFIDWQAIKWISRSDDGNLRLGFSAIEEDNFILENKFQDFIDSGYDLYKTLTP